MGEPTLADVIVRALSVSDGDIVVLEPQDRLTEDAYRSLRSTFGAMVEARPELKRVVFLLVPNGEFDLEVLTKAQRDDLRAAVLTDEEAAVLDLLHSKRLATRDLVEALIAERPLAP